MANPLAEPLNPLVHEPAPLRNKIMNSPAASDRNRALEPGTRLGGKGSMRETQR